MDALYEQINKSKYDKLTNVDGMKKNKKGQIVLEPKAKALEERHESLTTNISDLESKLQKFKAEKERTERDLEVAIVKEGKTKSKKKGKKEKKTLLKMVFNNADSGKERDGEEEEVGEYRDKKEKKKAERKSKKTETSLDTGLGQRFSPVVSMLHDTILEFDNLAEELQKDLDSKMSKGMYKSSQTANLISAKTAKLRAVTELGSIAKTITDIEMKKAKETNKDENDTTKAINSLGIKMLRGGFDNDDVVSSKKRNKNNRKKSLIEDDDEDDDFYKSKKSKDSDLARELAKKIGGKNDMGFTAHEMHIEMEGKYKLVILADPSDLEGDWKFVAVDKGGKPIQNFKDKYPGLIPKKKNCRMVFDMNKMQVKDKENPGKTYPLVLKD